MYRPTLWGANVLKKRAQPKNPHGATRVFPLRKLRVSAVSCLELRDPIQYPKLHPDLLIFYLYIINPVNSGTGFLPGNSRPYIKGFWNPSLSFNKPSQMLHAWNRPLFWLEFRPCFEGLTFKNRAQLGSRYTLIPEISAIPVGGFLKWWYPTTMGFPTKNDHHFVVFWGHRHFRKPPPPYRGWNPSQFFRLIFHSHSTLIWVSQNSSHFAGWKKCRRRVHNSAVLGFPCDVGILTSF